MSVVLAAAAQAGDAERVAALLRADPSALDARNADGWTALHLAAHYGHADVVRLLLTHGADVAVRSTNTLANQPLHAAVAGGRTAVVELLLAQGADANATQHGGWTPLHGAAQLGDVAMVRALLARGADVAVRSADGPNANDLAMAAGHPEVVALLTA